MKPGWLVGVSLYMVCLVCSILVRWPYLSQSYTNFEWITAHSHVIIGNWLANGFWNERGISLLNPPSIEFPNLVAREPYISYPCGAQLPLFVFAKLFGVAVTPGFFYTWSFLWYGLLGVLLMAGVWLLSAKQPEPERSLGTFLTGILWLGGRGPLTFFPNMWYADIVVLAPFVVVILIEITLAHGLLGERSRQWLRRSLPVLVWWGTYTDWLFVPLCAVILVYRLWQRQNVRATLMTFGWQIVLPATFAVVCFVLQGFWVLGSQFVPALLDRFLTRTLDTTRAFTTWQDMVWYFLQQFYGAIGGVTIVLVVLMLPLLLLRRRLFPRPLHDFLVLLVVPSVLLWFIFRQHAAVHVFSVVKFMLPMTVLLGITLPWALRVPYKTIVLVVLGVVFLGYEGWQYRVATGVPMQRYTLAWGEAIRSRFGYQDVLFTLEPDLETPAMPPMQVALSRKRIYAFDVDHIARMQRELPAARVFLIGTASALDAYCRDHTPLPDHFVYCRL